MLTLLMRCMYCWLHGFQTKTGNESWLQRDGMLENLTYKKGSQRRWTY